MIYPSPQRSVKWRTSDALREAESRAVGIRKLLRQLKGRRLRGVTDDAVKLAISIEQLARLGQTSAAEDAAEIESQIEVFTTMLGGEIDRFLRSDVCE